jgi:hypothetical protein
MRFAHSVGVAAVLGFGALGLVHCGASDTAPGTAAPISPGDAGDAGPGTLADSGDAGGYACATSSLTYGNFGEPFMLSWCRGCHSAGLAEGARQGAPLGVDFETREKVMQWQGRIVARAAASPPTMPPRGGPAAAEVEQLREWVACGLK